MSGSNGSQNPCGHPVGIIDYSYARLFREVFIIETSVLLESCSGCKEKAVKISMFSNIENSNGYEENQRKLTFLFLRRNAHKTVQMVLRDLNQLNEKVKIPYNPWICQRKYIMCSKYGIE